MGRKHPFRKYLGKDWRKPYRDNAPKVSDVCARHDGGCPFCTDNRQHSNNVNLEKTKEEMEEALNEFGKSEQ